VLESVETPRAKARKPKMVSAMILAVIVSVFAISEMVLRVFVGLGDPPLLIPHDTIGYVNKPGHYRRFGNDIRYNSCFIRSEPIAPKSANELRVLVCGDSIVHGTARVDQTELATAIAQRELDDTLKRPVSVFNISACGWGPRNVLAYLDKYGTFGADLSILVFNEGDMVEASGGGGRVYPTVTPTLALQEAFQLAAQRLFGRSGGITTIQRDSTVPSIDALFGLFQGQGVEVTVFYHPSAAEAQNETQNRSYPLLARCAEGRAVNCVSLRDDFVRGLRRGEDPWRPDGLHLTVRGQAILAEALVREVLKSIKRR